MPLGMLPYYCAFLYCEELKRVCFVYRLHKLLLQPRGFKPVESSGNENTDKACPLKVKKVIGKIRVEGLVFNLSFSSKNPIFLHYA